MFGPTFTTPGELRALKTATQRHAAAMSRAAKENGAAYSLTQLILSQLPNPHITDRVGLEAAQAMSHMARQTSGGATADGTYVPFAALARDLTTSNTSAAVATTKHNELAASLAPIPSILGAGCTILTGLSHGTLSIPTMDTGVSVSANWTAENGLPTSSEPQFGARALASKSLIAELVISRRLLQQSGVAIENELRKELLKRVLNEIDRAIVAGDGVNQPLGILNDSSVEVLSAGANGAAPIWDHIVELEAAVGGRSGQLAAPAFVCSPALRKKLRKTPKGTNLDFILPGSTLLEQAVHASALLPVNLTKGTGTGLTPLIYGDLSEVIVGFWGPAAIDLMVDPFTYGSRGAVRLVARVEVGAVVRQAGALSMYKDINPA